MIPGKREAGHALDRRAKLEITAAVMLAMFLSALDQTIVGTALPRIVTDLGGNDLYTWAATIYLLTSTIAIPFYGKLSDHHGRRPMLVIAISMFLVGSALCGLSQNMFMLILFRGLQGLGAGGIFPVSNAVLGDLFTPAERGRYQGLFGAVFGFASITGPFAGGLLTDRLSWHWIFYVNIPVGLAALAIIARLLPRGTLSTTALRFDWLGSAVFVIGVSLGLIGLTNKQAADWSDPSVGGLLAASALLLGIFLLVERGAPEAIVPLRLWRNRTYACSMIATFFGLVGFFSAAIFLPRWFQFVRGTSATESGYQILPLTGGVIVGSFVVGQLIARTGRYKPWILVSTVTMGAGLFLLSGLETTTALPLLALWMFVAGVGIGPSWLTFTVAVQNAVHRADLGVATGNLIFFRQIGGSIGIAIAGTIFTTKLQAEIPLRLAAGGVPSEAIRGLQSGAGVDRDLVAVGRDLGAAILAHVPAASRDAVQPLVPTMVTAVHDAFTAAVGSTFAFSVVVTGITLVASLLMPEVPLRRIPAPAGGDARS